MHKINMGGGSQKRSIRVKDAKQQRGDGGGGGTKLKSLLYKIPIWFPSFNRCLRQINYSPEIGFFPPTKQYKLCMHQLFFLNQPRIPTPVPVTQQKSELILIKAATLDSEKISVIS